MSESHAALLTLEVDPMLGRVRTVLVLVLLGCGVLACKKDKPAAAPAEDPQCREDVGDDIEMGARTGVSGAKTGVTTGVEGVKAAGSSAVGLVEGGSDEASKRWQEGKKETKATAREGRAETKREANKPKCRPR